MAGQNIMNIIKLKELLGQISNEVGDDFQVWLSSDEEGNEFLPLSEKPELCLAIDKEAERIILFPLHR